MCGAWSLRLILYIIFDICYVDPVPFTCLNSFSSFEEVLKSLTKAKAFVKGAQRKFTQGSPCTEITVVCYFNSLIILMR